MRAFLAAVQFLTPLPLSPSWQPTADDLRRSPVWFPLVGLAIGILLGLIAVDAHWLLPQSLAAGIAAVALSAASGFLHLDGLADTADGLLACSSREKALEIMRDSRIGAMGAMAICAVLGLKAAALFSLPGSIFWRASLFLPVAGRCAMLAAMAVLPYARSSGAAAVFALGRSPGRAVWGALFALAAGWLVAGGCGLAAAAAALLSAAALSLYTWRRLGGATGDTLGATCELAELLAVMAFSAFFHG